MILTGEQSARPIELATSEAGDDQIDVALTSIDRRLSRFANSELHQNTAESSAMLTVRVLLADGRLGTATTSSLAESDIRQSVRLARFAANSASSLPGFAGHYSKPVDVTRANLFDDATAWLDPSEKARLLGDIFDEARSKNISFAGSLTDSCIAIATGNSSGVRRYAATTQCDASFIAVSGSNSGHATQTARRIGDLDLVQLSSEAVERAGRFSDRPRQFEGGPCVAIVEPAGIADLFEWINMITFSGQSFEEGSSLMHGKLGEQIFGSNVTIVDDAADPGFLPFPFDMEGLPKKRITVIDRGVATTPLVDYLYAGKLGLEATASAAGLGSDDHGSGLHLCLAAGSSSREEMIRGTERGVLVTRFHYVNGLLDPRTALMTGMTRDGTFLIEHGEITGRLPNLRWTQSISEAFSSVMDLSAARRAIGSSWNPIGGTLAPAVRFETWNFDPSR
ncbi:MAG TPA: TldD/PmbA family protein [Thermoanaerobaculia bacterium]|nr:TldD/PmbA family protein [Thermoanaerobaculia bacterium]